MIVLGGLGYEWSFDYRQLLPVIAVCRNCGEHLPSDGRTVHEMTRDHIKLCLS